MRRDRTTPDTRLSDDPMRFNPATVTKLADRGSSQARGIVTDVGLFLEQLAGELVEGYTTRRS